VGFLFKVFEMSKAIIIGATGLIGTALIKALSENSNYSEVILIARKTNSRSFFKIQINSDRF
jgi:uncharacterized protein YbjT (DUF2867 family)